MLQPETQPRLSLTEAYHATQRWLDHAGLPTASIDEPADGVVELRSATHLARIRINTGPVSQGAVLALLRAAEEAELTPLLFSATGFTNGAIGFSGSRRVGLFDLGADGDVVPMNTTAGQLMPAEALEPAFAKPIESAESIEPISYFEVPTIEDSVEPGETFAAGPGSDWRSCAQCGATHHPGSHFCASCGTDLTARTAGGQLLGPRGTPAQAQRGTPVPSAPRRVGPSLRCRTCGSPDIELVYPD